MNTALGQLDSYIKAEGPFDGVIGFSQGAALAATYLIRHYQLHPTTVLPFKCALFFAGGKPLDPKALEKDNLVLLDPKLAGPLLRLPTANVWDRNDPLWPGSSEVLLELCDTSHRNSYTHDEGHGIPGKQKMLRLVR
jgi:hypothetical protein